MAKSKAKNVKKKVSSYDDKLIKIIGAALAGAVALLVAVILVVSFSTSYVCKVGGKRVMTYEYRLFLGSAMEQMLTEAEEAHEGEKDFDAKGFWTAEKIAEAEEKALNDVCEWKANYLIAKKEGYGLSWSERNEYKANVEAQIQYAYQYQMYYTQNSNLSYSAFLESYLSGMTMDEYKDYAVQDKCISDFVAALKEGYTPTDAQLEEKFNSDKDAYRQVILYTFAVEKPDEPKKELGEEPKKPDAEEGSKEYTAYEAALKEYEKLKKEWDEYNTELAELKEKVELIYEGLLEDGTYTGKGIKELEVKDELKKDSDKTESDKKKTEIKDYKDATLEVLAETEGDLFADTKGKHEFNKNTETEDLVLDDYALSLDWTDENRVSIKTTSDNSSFATELLKYDESKAYKDGKVTTKLVLLSDDTYFYITQCRGIKDLVTNAEPWETDEKDKEGNVVKEDTCVKDTVKADVLTDMAEAELEGLRKGEYSSSAKVTAKKEKIVDEVVEMVSSEFKG